MKAFPAIILAIFSLLVVGLMPITGQAAFAKTEQTRTNATDFERSRLAFLNAALENVDAAKQTLWLDRDAQKGAKKILRHKFGKLRATYWQENTRTVWVLQEIGKYKPISVGIVVDDGVISTVKVLAYRESHGWEVKKDFFTRQFIGSKLTNKKKLDQNVDGISGATLSVRALKKLARLALYFDAVIVDEDQG